MYVLQYFHGGKFRTTLKFEYVNGSIEKFQVDLDRLCICDILENVELLGYGQHKFVYYRDPSSDFNYDGLVLIHNDDTIRQVIQLLVGKDGSYDLGPDIEALEAAGEELRTTIEDLDDTVLEFAIDGGPREIANGGGLKEVADGFDHACDGGPRRAIGRDADGPM
ncbi:hypothetical protein V6N13_034366 [Hibiscus sabdariffa]